MTQGLFFRKSGGWYEVPGMLEDVLSDEPLHDTDPDGAKVFDVASHEEAARIMEREKKREDPRGTVSKPAPVNRIAGSAPIAPTPAAAPAPIPLEDEEPGAVEPKPARSLRRKPGTERLAT